MKRIRVRSPFILAFALLFLAPAVLSQTVAVGACLPHLKSYPTISQAVSSVTPGSTIEVCPGTYPEQVIITQPLTLRGVQAGNADNATVTVPASGLTKSVIAPANGATMFFQILVQGTESGMVNINNLAINGSSTANSGLSGWIEGIYYQNSSGVVNGVATKNQKGNGNGFGIFAEATTSSAKTVTVKNSSVRDFDAEGIRTNGNVVPSLTVNITFNTVISSSSFTGRAVFGGIDIQGAAGSIMNNRVVTHPASAGISTGVGIGFASNSTITGNTVANFSAGIWALGTSNTIKSNQVSLAGSAIILSASSNVVENNFLFNLNGGA
jgi:parallel beta-helix repeat protein